MIIVTYCVSCEGNGRASLVADYARTKDTDAQHALSPA